MAPCRLGRCIVVRSVCHRVTLPSWRGGVVGASFLTVLGYCSPGVGWGGGGGGPLPGVCSANNQGT